jgi:hypothetical protein
MTILLRFIHKKEAVHNSTASFKVKKQYLENM